MAELFEVRFNQSVLDAEYKIGPFHVTREMIALYSSSTGDANPRYNPNAGSHDVIAPPSLPVVLIDDWEPPDLRLEFDGVLYLAGYWVEPIADIAPGDVLRATIKVTDVYPKTGRSGPMVFLKKEAIFTNQEGVKVVRVGGSSVWRK